MQQIQRILIRGLGGDLHGGLVLVLVQHSNALGGVSQRTGTGNAAARAGHAFQQVAVVLAGLGHHHHLLAVGQTLGAHDLDLAVRVHLLDGVDNRLCDTAGGSKAAGVGTGAVEGILRVVRQVGKVDSLGLKQTHQLLEGQDEVDLTADGTATGLQLLGGAGADKADTGVGLFLLDEAGGQDHGGHGHADALGLLGEQLLSHHAPRRAAGRTHERDLGGNLFHEVLCLVDGAQVGTDGDLGHIGKAQPTHGFLQLGGGHAGELVDEGGGNDGNDLVTALDGLDQLEDLALVGDGGEGAVHQAHTAGDALIIIDLSPAQLIGLDGVHAAGGSTGTLHLGDRPVGALVKALAALDTLALINVAALVFVQIDGILGADVHAGVGNAALAAVGDADLLGRAGVAGIGDDIDQGLVEIFLIRGGILDIGADGGRGAVGVQIHAQSQLEPGGNNGPLQEHVMAMVGNLSGNDLVGDHVHLLVIVALIGQSGHFCEYAAADIVYRAVYTSHVFPPVSGSSRILLRHR